MGRMYGDENMFLDSQNGALFPILLRRYRLSLIYHSRAMAGSGQLRKDKCGKWLAGMVSQRRLVH